jgi:hypothetical protein
MLPYVIEWQRRNGYPLTFACEATLNLAKQPQILEMMREARFVIGMKSRQDSLIADSAQYGHDPKSGPTLRLGCKVRALNPAPRSQLPQGSNAHQQSRAGASW